MPAYELGPGEVGLPADRPIPERNSKGYDPTWRSPDFPHILRAAHGLHVEEVIIVIIGKLYKGGTPISGVAVEVEVDAILNAMLAMREPGARYNDVMKDLLGLNEAPIHVTHVILKPAY